MKFSLELSKEPTGSTGLTGQLLNSLAAHPSNYWIGFISDPVTAILFMCWDTFILHRNVYLSLTCYGVAIFFVSLCEYLLHRCIFHGRRNMAQAGHVMHHDSPKALIGTPWFVTSALWWSIAYVTVYLLSIPYALSFMAAFITGYTVYAIVHHHLHRASRSRRFRKLRIHHNIHHRIPDVNFGVTNRFWDKVFGTLHDRLDYKQRKSAATC